MTLRAAFVGIIMLFIAAPRIATAAEAAGRPGVCAGTLHRDQDGLRIGGGKGEDEGICLVGKAADIDRVLAVCTVEHHCRVKGRVRECKDAGECVEMVGITAVRKK